MTHAAAASLGRFTGLCVRSPRAETLTLVLKLNLLLLAKCAEVPITMVVELILATNVWTVLRELDRTVLARFED